MKGPRDEAELREEREREEAAARLAAPPATGPVVPHCIVPRLKGLSLASSRRRLRAADCRIGTVDRAATVTRIDTNPRVLPAPECPAAAASAQRLVGCSLGQLREHVASSFTGTSTCTHLNDALRALGDLDAFLTG